MLEKLVEKFSKTKSVQDSLSLLRYCRVNKLYSIGVTFGKTICELYPHIWNVLNETALCFYYIQDYESAYELFNKVLDFGGLAYKQSEDIVKNISFCIDKISNTYTFYNSEIVRSLTQGRKNPFPLLTLTMTSCKRYELFEQTVNSFLNCCTDIHRIDKWICVDDNSSEADRKKMKEKYPFFEFYFKSPSEKGHPQSMNIIKKKVDTPYIFHLEDDWKFFSKRDYISECFSVLHSHPKIGQCLINKNYAETSKDTKILGGIPNRSPKGLRFYVHEYTPDKKSVQEFIKKHGPGVQCAYWPHFSFRPSLFKKSVWDSLGDFNEKVSHFEMEYAHRYVKAGYVSAFLENIYCLHIGRLTSERDDITKLNAYILNGEKQFSGKEKVEKKEKEKEEKEEKEEEKKEVKKIETKKKQPQRHVQFSEKKEVKEISPRASQPPRQIRYKMYVLNLNRRPDRWRKFNKTNTKELQGLNYLRYEAVDGDKLVSTPQLLRIFDTNDYNMRTGMVGCAMSHFKMYTELLNGKDNDDFWVILEDDVEVAPDFKKKLIHTLNTTPHPWDIIYLGHHYKPNLRKPEYYSKRRLPTVEKWSRAKSLSLSLGGTGGYIISRNGAKKLLDFINRVGMKNCIDTMQQKAADELDVYYCTPHLIYSECWTGDNNPDTDIQFNYNSLSVDINKRFVDELMFYKNDPIQTVINFNQMKALIQSKNQPKVLVYRDESPSNIYTLTKLCNQLNIPFYTLEEEVIIVVPKPTQNQLQNRYFHRFQKNGKYSVEDAIKEK